MHLQDRRFLCRPLDHPRFVLFCQRRPLGLHGALRLHDGAREGLGLVRPGPKLQPAYRGGPRLYWSWQARRARDGE